MSNSHFQQCARVSALMKQGTGDLNTIPLPLPFTPMLLPCLVTPASLGVVLPVADPGLLKGGGGGGLT